MIIDSKPNGQRTANEGSKGARAQRMRTKNPYRYADGKLDGTKEPARHKRAKSCGGVTAIKTPKRTNNPNGEHQDEARRKEQGERCGSEVTAKTPRTKKKKRKVARTRPSHRSLYHGQGVGCQGATADGTRRNWHGTFACYDANLTCNKLGPSVSAPWHLQGDKSKRQGDRRSRHQKVRADNETTADRQLHASSRRS